MIAITRLPGEGLGDCALTFVERQAIDVGRAKTEHAGYCAALEEMGVKMRVLQAEEGMPDGMFVEDAAVVLEEAAVVGRMGAESRRGEVESVAKVLGEYREVIWMKAGRLEGGDVMRVGKRIYVGVSARTNRAGMGEFAGIVQRFGYEVVPVAVRGCLHLKTGATALDGGTVLVNKDWVEAAAFLGMRTIEVAEAFGGNGLVVGGKVIVSASFPRTRARIENAGFGTRVVEIGEFEKMEAGVTCMSLVFGV
jgi:dimethylargininase